MDIVDDDDCQRPAWQVAEGGRYLLILQIAGRSNIQQGSIKVSLEAEDLLIADTGIPVRMRGDAVSRRLLVYFRRPRSWPEGEGRQLPAIRPISGASGLAAGLRYLVLAVRSVAASLTLQEQQGLQKALFDLALAVSTCRAGTDSGAAERGAGGSQLASLHESIESRLTDPGLCPARIAAAHGISTRQLHRLFKAAGTPFGAFVRRRRLEHCRADLADPLLRQRPMTEIAYRWGFSDSSHFSRCFRAAFGRTARDFRAGREPRR